METTKTTKEALQILGRYIGQKVDVIYTDDALTQTEDGYTVYENGTMEISAYILVDFAEKAIKSFSITSLRSLDEMTEEESKKAFHKYCGTPRISYGGYVMSLPFESIHYLESIGLDTMDLKDKTIFIKD